MPDHAGNHETETTATKAKVAAAITIVGAAITSALTFASDGSPEFVALTVASATLTAAGTVFGVWVTPNSPKP